MICSDLSALISRSLHSFSSLPASLHLPPSPRSHCHSLLLFFRQNVFCFVFPEMKLSETGQIAKYFAPPLCLHFSTLTFASSMFTPSTSSSCLLHKALLSSQMVAGLISRLSCLSTPANRIHFDAFAAHAKSCIQFQGRGRSTVLIPSEFDIFFHHPCQSNGIAARNVSAAD